MQTANLIVAIIYTILLSLMVLVGLIDSDIELIIGIALFSPPVVLNWLSYSKWEEKRGK